MSKQIITHADIMRRVRQSGLDISHENVRYYRVNRDVPKQRKKTSKYAAAIEAAEQELINELLQRLTNGKDKRTSRKSANEPAAAST